MDRWRARTGEKSGGRWPAAIFLPAIIPLIAAIFLADSMFSRAAAVWFNPEVGQQLDRGMSLYKDYVGAIKSDLRHQTELFAADEALGEAARAGDAAKLSAQLDALIRSTPELAVVEVSREGARVARRDRGRPVDDGIERRLDVSRALKADATLTLTASFAVDRRRLDELEASSAIVAKYHQIEASRTDLYKSYVRAFALLLSLTIALTLLSGIVLARGVTTRINRLARAIELVGRGDLDVRVPVTGSDELTDLASTFNEMLGDMQRAHARIEFLQRVGAWQQMAQRLAHEIKNPLTPIQLAVQECHRRYSGDDAKYRALLDTTLEIVLEEVGTLRRLVGDFSAFARLPHAALESADLVAFIAECRDQLGHLEDADAESDVALGGAGEGAPTVGAAAIAVSWEVPAGVIAVRIDRQMLRRVMVNLVRNAVQAIRGVDGLATGRVVVRARSQPGGGAAIEVEDSGPGVPKGARERVFDPYFTTKAEGTGLGLAIVKKIVVEHGGSIEVAGGRLLGGALFVIRLPDPTDVSTNDARRRALELGVLTSKE